METYLYPISKDDFESVDEDLRGPADVLESVAFDFYVNTLNDALVRSVGKGIVELVHVPTAEDHERCSHRDNVRVDLGDNVSVGYTHVVPSVSVGEEVDVGTVLGLMDPHYGRDSCNHLHFTFYRRNGESLDGHEVRLMGPQDI